MRSNSAKLDFDFLSPHIGWPRSTVSRYRPRQTGGVKPQWRKITTVLSNALFCDATRQGWARLVRKSASPGAHCNTERPDANPAELGAFDPWSIDDAASRHMARFSLRERGTRTVRDRHGAVQCECRPFIRDPGQSNCIPHGRRRTPVLKPLCR